MPTYLVLSDLRREWSNLWWKLLSNYLKSKKLTPRSPISDSSPSSRIFRSGMRAQTWQFSTSAIEVQYSYWHSYLESLHVTFLIVRQIKKDVIWESQWVFMCLVEERTNYPWLMHSEATQTGPMISDGPVKVSSSQTNTWGTYAQTPETTQSSVEILLLEKLASESGGDLGQRTCPARISASPSNAVG